MTTTMINGKHRGKKITHVPVGYLKWMVNNGHPQAEAARAELGRRGTITPTVEISGHAIDRFSQRRLTNWQRHREGEEGLHHYMVRLAEKAVELRKAQGKPCQGRMTVTIHGIPLIFEFCHSWPVLLSVL